MRALVGGYVEEHGRRLSATVRSAAAAADPADQREPRAPRPLCAQLLQALAAARDETALLIDEQSTSGEPFRRHCVHVAQGSCVNEKFWTASWIAGQVT